jgi:hypothetical protein
MPALTPTFHPCTHQLRIHRTYDDDPSYMLPAFPCGDIDCVLCNTLFGEEDQDESDTESEYESGDEVEEEQEWLLPGVDSLPGVPRKAGDGVVEGRELVEGIMERKVEETQGKRDRV